MAEIIHEHRDVNDGSNAVGWIVALIAIVLLAALLWYGLTSNWFGLGGANQTNINVQPQQTAPGGTGGTGGTGGMGGTGGSGAPAGAALAPGPEAPPRLRSSRQHPRKEALMPMQTKTNDIFELLEQDHKEIRQLLTRVADKEDYQAFPALAAEINAHVEAEEQAFYQPLQDRGEQELHEAVLEGFEEHHVGELVMRELDRNNRGSERWHAKAMVFKEIIEHHLEEEETPPLPAGARDHQRRSGRGDGAGVRAAEGAHRASPAAAVAPPRALGRRRPRPPAAAPRSGRRDTAAVPRGPEAAVRLLVVLDDRGERAARPRVPTRSVCGRTATP